MSCATNQLSVFQGDHWAQSFEFWEDEEETLPLDLSGVTAVKMQLKKQYTSAALIDISLADGDITIVDNTINVVGALIPDDAPSGMYLFDIETISDGLKKTYGTFSIDILKQITV
jgi:hypothetical protein